MNDPTKKKMSNYKSHRSRIPNCYIPNEVLSLLDLHKRYDNVIQLERTERKQVNVKG
jgi:hypothetical protein